MHDPDTLVFDKFVIEEFNKFIKNWTGTNYPHLIDSDENDGEKFRQLLRGINHQLTPQN